MVLDFFKLYFVTLALFIFFDYLWLFFVASNFIRKGEEGISPKEAQSWYYVFYFYFIFVAGIILLAVLPGVLKESAPQAILRGFTLGLFVYGLYNMLSNKESQKFSVFGNIIDLFWGGISAGLVSGISYFIYFNYLL